MLMRSLETKIHQARTAYFLAGHLKCDVFGTDCPLDELDRLMDKLSEAEKRLEGRLRALEDLYEIAHEETYHTKSICRMWDSYHKYHELAKMLTEETRVPA